MLKHKHIYNLPNMLTFLRIQLVPLLVIFFYLPVSWARSAAAVIFLFASLTDWLDGYLARSFNQSTKLGAFLDPVADKLMVATALILIVAEAPFPNVTTAIAAVPAAIIVGREIIVSGLREWMAEIGERSSVSVNQLGKTKTAVQMGALIILLYCQPGTHYGLFLVGFGLLYAAAILTIWSMLVYLKAARVSLMSE